MSDVLANSDTPRKSLPLSGGFNSRRPDRVHIRRESLIAMKDKVSVPKISAETFVNLVNPLPSGVAERDRSHDDAVFAHLPVTFDLERDMYGPLMEALNNAKICPNHTFVATPHKPDGDAVSNEAVDGGLYPSAFAPQPTPGKGKGKKPSAANDWSELEVAIECKLKTSDGDPFDDDAPGGLRNNNGKCLAVFAQLVSYSQRIYYHQHRTHQCIILFVGDYARIIFVDRSCIFVSKRIPYKTDPGALLEFFWRIARHERKERGHDITAERIRDPESMLAQKMIRAGDKKLDGYDYPRQLFKKSLTLSWPWWRLTVQCMLPDHSKVERKFLVGRPHTIDPGVSGRGTRSYVALEDKGDDDGGSNPHFVYLKDSWRILHPDIDEEGKTLSILNDKGIAFVPTLVCHGDIEGQDTKGRQAWWMRYNPEQAKIKECPIRVHSHYRLVVKEVCRPLEDFKDDAELLLVMYCALRAHKQAYTLAGIIHRDISAGNILIYPDANGEPCGVLNDWELSKQLANVKPGGRQLERTGTWQFLSVAALDNPSKKIILQDDLESFFHALLYTAIRFLPHNCPDDHVGAFLYRYFDDYAEVAMGEVRCGPLKRTSVTSGKIPLVTVLRERVKVDLVFLMPVSSSSAHPINALIVTILSWLRAYNYTSTAPPLDVRKPSNPAPVRLRSFMQEDLEARRGLSADKHAEPAPTRQPATPHDAPEVALAAKLADHNAMLRLFLDTFVLCGEDPLLKGKDKKPAKGYDSDWEYYRGSDLGNLKAGRPSGGNWDVARSGDPPDATSGSGKRPHEGEDDIVDVGDLPTTPNRPRAAEPRSDTRSGP